MVYLPTFNEDVCAADFIVKHNHFSQIAARQQSTNFKQDQFMHLKFVLLLFFSLSLETCTKHQKKETNITTNLPSQLSNLINLWIRKKYLSDQSAIANISTNVGIQ